MNLEFALNDSYQTYNHIQIHRVKQKNYIIVIAYNSSENEYAALVITKQRSNQKLLDLKDILKQIGPYPSQQEVNDEIKIIVGGQYQTKQIIFAQGILGFHRFLQGYYLHYIEERQSIAKIGRHKINQITKTNLISLFQNRAEHKDKENKYKQILNQFKIQNFYYSTSYDMTNSLAKNMLDKSKPFYQVQAEGLKAPPPITNQFYSDDPNIYGICEVFQFNYGIVKQFSEAIKNKKWVIAVVHGYCKQINDNFKGTIFNIIVIARRSRHHAGTRYIKRGIDSDGFVANYVQIQQIVVNYSLSQDTRPICSSFIQIRGSVPTYWMQRPSIAIPKPNIQIRSQDYLCLATRKHFHDLIGRYGQSIFAINLMKSRQKTMRESLLSKQYSDAVKFINKNDLSEEHWIHYIEVDMKYHLKLEKNVFVSKIRTFAYYTIQKTGLFLCMGLDRSSNDQLVEFQNGVIRANCVDCLDRTNSFQQLVGQTVLGVQLGRLLKQDTKFQDIQLDQRILQKYSELYQRMGDLISVQYGSSYAHKQKIQKTTQSRNQFWIAIKRHFNNNLKDYDRQQQFDLFLGFRPNKQGPQLWEIKPPIQHFPSKRVKQFENYENYYESAYSYFCNQHAFSLLRSANDEKKSKGSWCHYIKQFGKDELKQKFQPQIVCSLINEKEILDDYRFCLVPKLILQKRVWTEMNPKAKVIESLQEKLSHPYNKMDYLKGDPKNEKLIQLNPKKSISYNEQSPKKKNNESLSYQQKMPNSPHTQRLIFIENETNQLNQLLQLAHHDGFQNLDQQQLQLIQQMLSGEIINENEIEQQIKKQSNQYLLSDNQFNINEDIYMRLKYLADEEIKHMENNFNKGNFFGTATKNPYKKSKRHNRENHQEINKNKKKQEKRKDYIRDNRLAMLQQIMEDNFSHGKIKGKVTEI